MISCWRIVTCKAIGFVLAFTLLSLDAAILCGQLPEPPKLEATRNGKPFQPSLQYIFGEGNGAKFLFDFDFHLALGNERKFDFTGLDRKTGLLKATVEGESRVVAAKVDTIYEEEKDKLVDPLSTLSRDEIRGLWGLHIDHWSPAIGEKLKLVDPARTCVTIGEGAQQGAAHALPPLPTDLVMLRIDSNSSEGLKSFEELRKLKRLKTLAVETVLGKFDCAVLGQAKELETLDLSGNELSNTKALASLTKLKVLNLSHCKNIKDISFVSGMRDLVVLNINSTPVEDLAPANGLAKLRTISANMSPIRKLPKQLPGAEQLVIFSAPLDDAAVAAFKRDNPNCKVSFRWREALEEALKPVTRMRIRTGGTCHRDKDSEETQFETKDVAEIQELLTGIELEEQMSGFHCMCCGNPSLEFYEGDKLVATLGFHHGRSFRWPGGWPADAALSQKSGDFVVDWLAKHNVKGPLEELEAMNKEQTAQVRKFEQAAAGMSPELDAAFREGAKTFRKELKRIHPEKEKQAEVLFRILGADNNGWSPLDSIDQFAEEALGEYATKDLSAAAESALRGDDRQMRRGAARFWQSNRSPLEDWKPDNIAELHQIVVQVEQEARYYSWRMRALDHLSAWRSDFTEDALSERLAAGLHDPEPQVRRQAMLVAGRLKHTASAEDLLSVLRGEALAIKALPEVPEAETVDVPEAFEEVAKGCPDRDVAALALGYLHHEAAKPILESAQPSTPMIEVALALFGDGARLKPEFFATKENNQELQLGAVEVVVRSKGKFGLKMALGYQQATHWWEEEVVSSRLSKMLLAEKAPGGEMLNNCKDLKVLKAWFDKHGAEYLKRFE